ncbi:MAG: hypothetical protein ACXVPY_15900, partial [Bacteroidia bacterium]
MKKQMFQALWACFALASATVSAQTSSKSAFNDTIIFMPDTQSKVILIGDQLSEMSSYKKIDSIKTLFINDMEEARKQASFPVNSKTTHYFVSPSGKRRLKAESEDYPEQEIDVAKEKRSLDLDLPPYEYIIHDFSSNYECQIYLKDPEQLKGLKDVNFSESLITIANNKKLFRKNFRLDLEKDGSAWKIKNKFGPPSSETIEMTGTFGASLIGGKLSPLASAALWFAHTNKHNIPVFKAGLCFSSNIFTDLKDEKFSDLTALRTYEIKFLVDMSGAKKAKPQWFGL